MTREEAINNNKNLRLYMRLSDKYQPCKFLEENYIALDMAIKALEQQPKTGHWIEHYGEDGCGELYSHWVCSKCGRSVGFNLANIEDVLRDYPYCHCGARMVEPQESEE